MPQGWLMLEHGFDQGAAVRELMAQAGLVEITSKQDLGGNDRVTLGKNPLIVSQHWA
jgi:release factor glutamine methyltransferase